MKTTQMVFAALSLVSLMASSIASADAVLPPLELRLNGKAVYDPVANLTWLQDANYAEISGPASSYPRGFMPWSDAVSWAGSLNIDGVTGWRLPGGPMLNNGYNQTASEMGNLFYNVLGGTAYTDINNSHNANYHLFKNVQSYLYWSGVEFNPILAWFQDFGYGRQSATGKGYNNFAWAVHDGDVGASPVPLPATLFLLAPALAGLGVMRRRDS